MILFIVQVIIVSILVSWFAAWFNLIPRYQKWQHRVLRQALNSGILTIVLIGLLLFRIHLSWVALAFLILGVLLLSVFITRVTLRITGRITKQSRV